MKKFEKAFDLLDELEFIREKISFMGEVTAALALRTETGGLSDDALCGLYAVNRDIENQCTLVSKALRDDFYIIEKTSKEASSISRGKDNPEHLNNFCSMVENASNAKMSQA